MKRLAAILVLFLCATSARATTYTVKAGGGGSFTTIQACATTAVAGDTCVVFAGTYNETVTPAHSGTAGNPIAFSVNPGDCVTEHGFTLGSLSYITVGNPVGPNCTVAGVVFPGFQITTHPVSMTSANNLIIQGNYINNVADICIAGPGTIGQGTATFIYVLNNTLTLCGGPAGLAGGIGMEGNHWLVDGNNISHVEDGMYAYGAFLVIRNNVFGPVTAAEEGSNHPDAIESTCTIGSDYPLQHMLFEGNTVHNWRSSDGHGLLLRDTQSCGQTQNVVRFNYMYVFGSNFISNDVNSTKEIIYNNSVSQMQSDLSPKDPSDLTFTNGDTGAQIINNIFQDDWRTGNSDFCIYSDSSSASGLIEHHNLCFLTGWSSSWQTSSFGAYAASDIFNHDPLFVSPSSDLTLQVGSPAIGVGGPLTTAVGAGVSSSSLTVANSAFFSDGYGITNVQGDWIRIGGSTTVQISSVNYSTNVLTLASPQTWNGGDSIFLYKNSSGTVVLSGSSPNIGAFQPAASTPIASFAPNPVTFPNTIVANPSAPIVVTLTNTGTLTMTSISISITGTNAADFGNSTTCSSTLTAGSNCTITVTFTPSLAAVESAAISVTDNAPGSPQAVPLSGRGVLAIHPAVPHRAVIMSKLNTKGTYEAANDTP